jgi:hypothetical protein
MLDRVAPRIASLARASLGAIFADADDIARAESRLAEAHASTDGLAQSVRIVELCRGHLDLARARAAGAAGDAIGASEHRAAARRRLEAGTERELSQFDVRFARRNLNRAFAAEPALARGLGAGEFAADLLVIEPTGAWFRAPNGKRVELAHRPPLRQLLVELYEQRRAHAGEPVGSDVLIRRAWPSEAGRNPVTTNRLRVALFSLRKLGLGRCILSVPSGYLLDPAVPVQSPEPAATT